MTKNKVMLRRLNFLNQWKLLLDLIYIARDVTINAFASVITLEQFNEQTNSVHKISLSMAQLRDLQAALDLPEGSYQFRRDEP